MASQGPFESGNIPIASPEGDQSITTPAAQALRARIFIHRQKPKSISDETIHRYDIFHNVRGYFLPENEAMRTNGSQSCPQVCQSYVLASPIQSPHSHFQRLHQRLAIPGTGDGLADDNPNGTGLLTEGAASPVSTRVSGHRDHRKAGAGG